MNTRRHDFINHPQSKKMKVFRYSLNNYYEKHQTLKLLQDLKKN